MNVERGFRRLVIVVSGLILAVGIFAVVAGGGRIGLAVVIVGVLLGLLWATFLTLRWAVRGFARRRGGTLAAPALCSNRRLVATFGVRPEEARWGWWSVR